MFPRITNASDINKPIIGVLDNNQKDKLTQMVNEYDYQLTPKKKIIRDIRIILISLIMLWALYCVLFVLNWLGDKVTS